MATVRNNALAIILNLSKIPGRFLRDLPISEGAGRRPEGNGGPPAARLGCRAPRSMGRDVAHVVRRPTEGREKWRAEVGPVLPGAGPRPLLPGFVQRPSFECLVFPEVGNRESEWVDGDQFIGNL